MQRYNVSNSAKNNNRVITPVKISIDSLVSAIQNENSILLSNEEYEFVVNAVKKTDSKIFSANLPTFNFIKTSLADGIKRRRNINSGIDEKKSNRSVANNGRTNRNLITNNDRNDFAIENFSSDQINDTISASSSASSASNAIKPSNFVEDNPTTDAADPNDDTNAHTISILNGTDNTSNYTNPETTINKMQIASILGLNDAFSIQSLFNPSATYIKNYVVLDSKYRLNTNETPLNKFVWSYVDNPQLQQGSVNTISKISNVVSVRLYQPRVPYVVNQMRVESKRISIAIEEFTAQSFISYTGRRYHFLLQPSLPTTATPPEMIELFIEDFADGVYNFRKPITTFETLSVTFGNPYNLISFNHDSDTVTFTYGAVTTVICSIPHLLASTTTITYVNITGFTTLTPVTDSNVINAINNKNEITATVVDGSTFTIPVDTSTITPVIGLTASIYFNERRIILPLELTYLRNDK